MSTTGRIIDSESKNLYERTMLTGSDQCVFRVAPQDSISYIFLYNSNADLSNPSPYYGFKSGTWCYIQCGSPMNASSLAVKIKLADDFILSSNTDNHMLPMIYCMMNPNSTSLTWKLFWFTESTNLFSTTFSNRKSSMLCFAGYEIFDWL